MNERLPQNKKFWYAIGDVCCYISWLMNTRYQLAIWFATEHMAFWQCTLDKKREKKTLENLLLTVSYRAVMEDIHNLGERKYICADEIKPLSASKKFLLSIKILTTIVPSLFIAFALAVYSVLKNVYHLVFPKPLKSIRGQLAVVKHTARLQMPCID